MTRPRELSIAFQTDKRPGEYRELAREVERLGFDALSMYSDLTFQPPIVPLALAALETSRIRLGPASLNPFTMHPIEIAGQIATLDMASNGRAYLGISRGSWLDAIGIEQERPVSRVVDALRAVGHLLRGEATAFEGRTFQMRSDVVLRYGRERERVPMLLGAWGRQLIREAAPLVDEIKLGGSSNPAIVKLVQGRLDALELREPPGIVLGAVTVVDDDGAAARESVRREMALYLPVVAPLDPTADVDPELLDSIQRLVAAHRIDDASRQIPDNLIGRFAFAGTPSQVIEQCEAIFEAGASRIEFGAPHGISTSRGLQLLGEVVLPALSVARR